MTLTQRISTLCAFAGLLVVVTGVQAQSTVQPASAPASANVGNKAAKPPVDAEAMKSGVATKKPAKAGAQSGPASSPMSGSMPAGSAPK